MVAPSLPYGLAIKYIRSELYLVDGNKLSQERVYWRCHDIEKKAAYRGGVLHFGHVQHDEPRHKIARIESGKVLTAGELQTLALAFDLPPEFFSEPFTSEADVKDRYDKAREAQQHKHKLAYEVGFRRVSELAKEPRSRSSLTDKVNDAVASASEKATLIVIDGLAGSGASYFVARWWQKFGRPIFGKKAICIDCTSQSLEQVRATLSSSPILKNAGAGSLTAEAPVLIVLDNLKLDGARAAMAAPLQKTPQIHPAELADFIAAILNTSQNVTLMVSLDVSRPPIDPTVLVERLIPAVEFRHFSLMPLTDEEGAEFLTDLGVTDVEHATLGLISHRLQGLPVALTVAAEDLKLLSPSDRERYLEIIAERVGPADGFVRFFLNYLNDLRATASDEEAHPHALLRLLALMPGPLPKQHLEELLSERRIRRLRRMTLARAIECSPFVVDYGDAIDVNGMVRGILRSELAQYTSTKQYDAHTSPNELEWIHWKCARLNMDVLEGGGLSHVTIASIEAVVYHMMAILKVLPQERRTHKYSSGSTPHLEQRIKTFRTATDKDIVAYCQQKVIQPFLMSSSRYWVTKIFGQYEAKARILELFLSNSVSEHPPLEAANFLSEIGICWMHAGKLASATEAMTRADELLRTQLGTLAPDDVHTSRSREFWRRRCNVAVLNATIDTRKGRQASMIEDALAPFVAQAANTLIPDGHHDGGHLVPSAARVTMKLMARRAHIQLWRGNVEQAIKTFDEWATLLQTTFGGGITGEGARTYAQALILGRHADAERLNRASQLIAANIAEATNHADGGRLASTDIIPLLIMRASITRVAGNFEQAADEFEAIERHEYVLKNQCTYVAHAQLEMERLRLAVAKGDLSRPLLERAKDLSARLAASHHQYYSQEARLLAAEFTQGHERMSKLDRAERILVLGGWRLRLLDIGELRAGRSAVKLFGV